MSITPTYLNHRENASEPTVTKPDFYADLHEQMPWVAAEVERQCELEEWGLSKDVAFAIASAVGQILFKFRIDPKMVTATTVLPETLSVELLATTTNMKLTHEVQGSTLEDAIVSIVGGVSSWAAGAAAGVALSTISVGLAGEVVVGTILGVAIPRMIKDGYESFKDTKAILKAETDETYRVECRSGLNEFLKEKWDLVKQFHEEGKDWSLKQEGDATGLQLTFNKNEGSNPPFSLVTSHTTYPDPELFFTLLKKIGTDFIFIRQGEESPEYIENYTALTLPQLIDKAETPAGLFAMEHLAPYVPRSEVVASDPDAFSTQYKIDRARFLYYSNDPTRVVFDGEHKIIFEDWMLKDNPTYSYSKFYHTSAQQGATASSSKYRRYTFGTAGVDTLDGSPNSDLEDDDHLYGMGGNDTLSGYSGNDYLEGGEGEDTLLGGDGDDIFGIMGEDDDYDIFVGGDGKDTIQGSKNNDTIRVNDFGSANSIEVIDGGGGTNKIKGTELVDNIDLTFTEEIHNIEGIYLEGDNDELTVNYNSNTTEYRIDGGAGDEDRLIGTDGKEVIHLDTGKVEGFEIFELKGGNDEIRVENVTSDDGIFIDGGEGTDTLLGTDKENTIDMYYGRVGNIERVEAGSGDDTIVMRSNASDESEFVDGGQDEDTIEGTDGTDFIHLTRDKVVNIEKVNTKGGNDRVHVKGISGDVFTEIDGGAGDEDRLMGTDGSDTFDMTHGNVRGFEKLLTGAGSDIILFSDQSQIDPFTEIDGGNGEASIKGTDSHDTFDFSNVELNDIKGIYGEGGNDTLTGSQGDDALYGGKGYDTYIINQDGGTDTIYEEADDDGKVRGVIKDGDGKIISSGVWEETGKDTGTYVNRETGAQATMNSPLTMQVGNSQVVIADFENGDFGINLLEYSEDTTSVNLTGGEDAEYLYDPSEPVSAGRNIQGNGGRDFVAGEEGNDVLSGGADNDWIVGAGGVDRIDGGSGNDYISWFDGGSSVSGGDGDDILTAVAKESFFCTPKSGFTLDAIWGDVASNLEFQYGDGFSLTEEGYLTKSWGALLPGIYTGDSAMGTGWTYSLTVGPDDQFDLKYFHPTEAPVGTNPAWEIGFVAAPQPQAEQGVVLMGDAGNDLLAGHNQSDVLSGGMDRDILLGNEGDDYLYGGGGNDDIAGGAGDDMVFGGDDTDYIYGESGSDTLYGEDGVDYIWGDSQSPGLSALDGNDFVDGGRGNDQIVGQGGDDTLMGGDGNDMIVGDNGDDSVAGDDTIYGDAGEDTLFGEGGNDTLYGGDDSDQILAGDGNDILSGGSGDDGLYGGAGDDIMSGGDGNDLLRGYTGIDEIDGGSGDDTLYGEDGDDILRGGTGNDTLEGGAGDDTYVFNLGDGADVIKNSDSYLTNSLAFGPDIGIGDLSMKKEGADLIIDVGDGGDQITVVDWYRAQGYQILYFNFDDGVVKSVFELLDEVPVKQTGTAENDTMNGSGSADFLVGGGGDDDLYGFRGNDILDGGDGNDDLYGSSENDTLSGGFGSDRLYGGVDDDTLAGGPGEDYLTGEAGDDTYVFNIGDGSDHIRNNDFDGMDTVSFGPGIEPSDISAENIGDSLILNIGSEEDRIHFPDWAGNLVGNGVTS